jgi:hypothetical protein
MLLPHPVRGPEFFPAVRNAIVRFLHATRQFGVFCSQRDGTQSQFGVFAAQRLGQLGQLADFFGKIVKVGNHPATIDVRMNGSQ